MKPLPVGNYNIRIIYQSSLIGGPQKGRLLEVHPNGNPYVKLDDGCDGETTWTNLKLAEVKLIKNKLGNFPRKKEVEL